MTHGLTRQQIGVTDAMIAAYGETIFRLSNNSQTRRGDPVRAKDFEAIERHRAELGMSDAQIAAHIGLSPMQVTFIRNLEERRRFRTGHYHMLNRLGGGKRFRAERMTPLQDHFRYSEDALALRAAFAFDPQRVRSYVDAGLWRDDTITKWIATRAKDNPDGLAVCGAGPDISNAELQARVERLAAGFWKTGIRPGDVVAVQLPNSQDYVLCFFALCRLGAVMTTLYATYREAEFRTQLAHSRARAVIVPDMFGDFAAADCALRLSVDLPALHRVIVVGNAPAGAATFTELAACDERLPDELPQPSAADPFLLLYTSGTTSAPKGVPLNYHQMLSNARVGVAEHDIRPGDRVMSAAPFGHLYGLYSIQLALAAGAAIALLPMFSPPAFVQSVADLKPTHVFAGPPHLAACMGMGLLDTADLSSLRVIVLSGSAVPPELVRAAAPKMPSCAITQLWGMTETQAGLYSRPSDPMEVSATTAGRASPGTEVRIADEFGVEAPRGEEGELQVRGPSVFAGYYNNPQATEAAFTPDGFFRSGDLATMDSGGHVSLSGRLKDVINRGGVKYNPQEVELLVETHPAIAQCAIAPVPDERLGERACCYVVLKPKASLTLEELCMFLAGKSIAKHKLPEHLEVREAFPMTATRKVIKAKLRDGG